MEWFDVTNNKRFVPGGVDQEFKEGNVYKVTIHFRSKLGYEFVEEEAMIATINGREAAVEYVTYGDFAGISYTFEALKHLHDMERINKVSPTCTAAGKQTYYHCKSCDKYYEDAAATKQIKDLASWGNVAALGHVESDLRTNSTHHFKVCTRCYKEIDGSKATHSGGTATCMTPAKCKDCGAAYGKLADHNLATDVWGFIDASGHAHMCLTQGCYYRSKTVPHRSSGPATDDKDEVCLDCGYVITLSKNHTHAALEGYRSDSESHWHICGCGEVMDKNVHTDADGDNKCDVCSYLISEDVSGGTDDSDDGNDENDNDNDNNNDNAYIVWIVIGGVLVLGAVAAVVAVILLKKKKKKE